MFLKANYILPFILLLLAWTESYCQASIDSLIQNYRESTNYNTKMKIADEIGQLTSVSRRENSISILQHVGELAQQKEDYPNYHRFQIHIALALIEDRNFTASDSLLEQVERSTRIHNDPFNLSEVLRLRGKSASRRGLKVTAIRLYSLSRELKISLGDNKGIQLLNNWMAIMYMGLKDWTKAKELLEENLNLNLVNSDNLMMADIYAHLAECCIELGDLETANRYKIKSELLFKKVDSPRRFYPHFINTIYYIKLGELDSARLEFDNYLQFSEGENYIMNGIYLSEKLARQFGFQNRRKEQKQLLDYAASIIKPNSSLSLKQRLYQQYVDYYLSQENIKMANTNLTNWENAVVEYQDQVTINAKAGEDLLVKENVLRNEINGLVRQKNETIESNRTIRNFSILLGLTALGLLFFLFKARLEAKQKEKLLLQIKHINSELQTNVEQKQFLLKEIHHRVKNNLQDISSLLNLQANHYNHGNISWEFENAINRIKSIALIHEFLYEKDNLEFIDVAKYANTLINNLKNFYIPRIDNVDIILNVEDMKVDVETMNSLGLIINELITNCFKYAFDNQVSSKIKLELFQKNNSLHLIVEDNGIGFNQEAANYHAGFGMFLINSLLQKLKGNLTFENSEGTKAHVSINKYKIDE